MKTNIVNCWAKVIGNGNGSKIFGARNFGQVFMADRHESQTKRDSSYFSTRLLKPAENNEKYSFHSMKINNGVFDKCCNEIFLTLVPSS